MLGNTRSGAPDLLSLVLGLLDGLAGSLLLLQESATDQSVLGLKLSHGILIVVDEAESSGLATSKLGSEAKELYELGISLVHASYHFLKLRLGDICPAGVNDVHNELVNKVSKKSIVMDGDGWGSELSREEVSNGCIAGDRFITHRLATPEIKRTPSQLQRRPKLSLDA